MNLEYVVYFWPFWSTFSLFQFFFLASSILLICTAKFLEIIKCIEYQPVYPLHIVSCHFWLETSFPLWNSTEFLFRKGPTRNFKKKFLAFKISFVIKLTTSILEYKRIINYPLQQHSKVAKLSLKGKKKCLLLGIDHKLKSTKVLFAYWSTTTRFMISPYKTGKVL